MVSPSFLNLPNLARVLDHLKTLGDTFHNLVKCDLRKLCFVMGATITIYVTKIPQSTI